MKCRTIQLLAAGMTVAVLAGSAAAHWIEGMPFKWVQLPDMRQDGWGIDVNATDVNPPGVGPSGQPARVLADDFLCTSTGPITEIHIWGSWKYDVLPGNLPTNIAFRLSIHSDVPAGVPHPEDPLRRSVNYSRPGPLLWQRYFQPAEFTVQPYGPEILEGWYDPVTGQYVSNADDTCWQYNFVVPLEYAFVQTGSTANPVTYWLDVDASVPAADAGQFQWEFGWKSSQDHWGDRAVWREDSMGPWEWYDMKYPRYHPLEGQNLDMAFVILPEPATLAFLGAGLTGLLIRRVRRK
ncbi:MAG: PEP-CTERM sorting domain-containing protein [Planctomycetes bacterium]|nr:PEP-CTERM sorting domain-containing protein [Planctomycetota bacterium]